MNVPARLALSRLGTVLLCTALVFGPSLLLPDLAAPLDTPETAMRGMARVIARDWLTVRCAGSTLLLLVIAIALLRSARTKPSAWIPAAAMLIGFAFLGWGLARIESTPFFRARVAESLPALDALAARARAGQSIALPCRAGHFKIVAVEHVEGNVVLYTRVDGVLSWERWGFVHVPGAGFEEAPATDVGLVGEPGEHNFVQRLAGDWFVLASHVGYVKRGWS